MRDTTSAPRAYTGSEAARLAEAHQRRHPGHGFGGMSRRWTVQRGWLVSCPDCDATPEQMEDEA